MFTFLLSSLLYAAPFTPFASEGTVIRKPVRISALGNTCMGGLLSSKMCGKTRVIMQSIAKEKPDAVLFLGDFVKNGNANSWAKNTADYQGVLGDIPVLAVPGESEYQMAPKLLPYAKNLPGMAEDIGLNRSAGWFHIRVNVGEQKWKILFLDANKNQMGSKWNEQLRWLDKTLKKNKDQVLVVLNKSPIDLGGSSAKEARVLLNEVKERLGLLQLRAVLFAGSRTTQAFLPEGNFDPLYVGCGGGGLKADNLHRFERKKRWGLHPALDAFYMENLMRSDVEDAIKDMAKGKGDYKKKRPTLSGAGFPTYGWCNINIDGKGIRIHTNYLSAKNQVKKSLKLRYNKLKGWHSTK
ncbi:MAG: metallophosphoesterase [Myxococcota bacterium]|nr:metallophosphoesterase [Myxococcota bacterium]